MCTNAPTILLGGWGNYPLAECRLHRPGTLATLKKISPLHENGHLIARGLGRSYGDPAINASHNVVLTDALDNLIHFDRDSHIVEAQAGVSLQTLLDVFMPRGYFLPVTPGTKFVTLGGAIAADVHGKNHHRDGSMVSFIIDLQLLTASGEVLICSRDENREVFWATVGGMGLTGIILSARLKLLPVATAYVTVDYHKAANLDEALEQFDTGDAQYQYSVAWIDCLASGASMGRSVIMQGNHATMNDLSERQRENPLAPRRGRALPMPCHAPGWALNPLSVKLFNAAFYRKHKNGRKVEHYDPFFYPLDGVNDWNRLYGRRGLIQYQPVLPRETSRTALVALLELLTRSKRASFLAVLKSYGPQNDGMLSFPLAGHTLALDLPYTGRALLELIEAMDRIVLEHGGRLYLAKDACMSRATFEAGYPRLAEFKQLCRQLDPRGKFSSSQSRRLGITEAIA